MYVSYALYPGCSDSKFLIKSVLSLALYKLFFPGLSHPLLSKLYLRNYDPNKECTNNVSILCEEKMKMH